MAWATYKSSLCGHDEHIRLEDIVGVEVYNITNLPSGNSYGVIVKFSGGAAVDVGGFYFNDYEDPDTAHEMACERAEEIKAAVDKAKSDA